MTGHNEDAQWTDKELAGLRGDYRRTTEKLYRYGDKLPETNTEAARAGENMKVGGAKMDVGKAEIFAGLVDYFPRALNEVALVSDYGAQKYSRGGWRTVPDAYVRYGNSLGRHYFASATGDYDTGPAGSDLLHDAQVAWNALARLEIGLRDGRYLSTPGRKINKVVAVDNAPLNQKSAEGKESFVDFEKRITSEGPTYMENLVKELQAMGKGAHIRVVAAPLTRNRFAEYYYGIDPTAQPRWVGWDFGSEEIAKPAFQKLKSAVKRATAKKAEKARRKK